MLTIDDLFKYEWTRNRVAVRPEFSPDTPLIAIEDRYPKVGTVIGMGPQIHENIKLGDVVLLDNIGIFDEPESYGRYALVVKDHDPILIRYENEPVIREAWQKAIRHPSKVRFIFVEDEEGVQYRMEPSDIISIDKVSAYTPKYKIESNNARTIEVQTDTGRVIPIYVVVEDDILGVLHV